MLCPRCHHLHPASSPCIEGGVPDPRLGVTVDGYQITRELGRGAAGVVYLAEHEATGLKVAIKLAHPHLAEDEAARERLGLEARYANQLALETVVNVFDFSDESEWGSYLVMEYLQGEPLGDFARRKPPEPQALVVLAQMAEVLAVAHRKGIVHGALEPSSVVLVPQDDGQLAIKLLPFGVPVQGELRISGFGSAAFRAPEQTGGATPDPRMDVYSLGSLAYLLATGRAPFEAPTAEALDRAHAEVVPGAPHRVNPQVSRLWSAIILRALQKSPERRFQSMEELAEAFLLAAQPVPNAAPEGAPDPMSAGLAADFVAAAAPAQRAAAYAEVIHTPVPQPAAPSPAQGLVLLASVRGERGEPLGEFACSSVTRAGLIICTAGSLPPLMSKVTLTLMDLDGLTLEAQVVHHVTPAQAEQWKLSPGYGVQFGSLSGEVRARLENAHQGLKPPETPSGIARRPDDPLAADVLKRFSHREPYTLLSLSKAAPFDAIRDRLRIARRTLDELTNRPLSLAQQEQLQVTLLRLDQVSETLGDPLLRMEHDARLGNYEGVARCISAGLPVATIEAARIRFAAENPDMVNRSYASVAAGESFEARRHLPQALEAYAEALRADPLNLNVQLKFWALRRQLGKT